MKIISLVGARPNFMKIAPILREMARYNCSRREEFLKPVLVHSGQHYDYELSKVFFEDLEIPEPDIHLNAGSGSHAQQTASVLTGFEKVLLDEKPDLVMLVGDINSTLAGALAASKLHIPIAHIEAGVRSGDSTMPEEINRLLTDTISDYLFTPSESASLNLRHEGISESRIFAVGNVMVDSLLYNKQKAEESPVLTELNLQKSEYCLCTLHRAANVDNKEVLTNILGTIKAISQKITIVFPMHPRTRKNIEEFGLKPLFTERNIKVIKPQGYIHFLKLLMYARFVMTDSGGIEPETTVLGIPCLTLMDTTAWQETVEQGTNILVGTNREKISQEVQRILHGNIKPWEIPPLWDGNAAERIIGIMMK